MAKGNANGLLSGKLGSQVFYRNTNSNNKVLQGVREYRAEISNPRTAQQVSQRMRLRPAVNFYAGMSQLLDHSWQGVKYGARSRARFMQQALLPDVANIPFVVKGFTSFVPGEYPISSGSVACALQVSPLLATTIESLSGYFLYCPGFLSLGAVEQGATWGEVSASIIEFNIGLVDGDELTFVWVADMGNNVYIPYTTYILLDVGSLIPAVDVINAAHICITNNAGAILPSLTNYDEGLFNFTDLVAGGIIVSRHPKRESSVWLRSTSFLQCTPEFKAKWMSNEQYEYAAATYQNRDVNLTSDWLLNQAENITRASTGNITTDYLVQNAYYLDGEKNVQCAFLSVAGQEGKPVLYVGGSSNYYFGVLVGDTISYFKSQRLANAPVKGSYYTVDQLTAATNKYKVDFSAIDDNVPIEKP